VWFSKSQPTVEPSVFEADFVKMKNGIDMRMMGMPFSGPPYFMGTTCMLYTTLSTMNLC
jgi:hypothetical protein